MTMISPYSGASVAVPSSEEWILKNETGEEYLVQIGFPRTWLDEEKPETADVGGGNAIPVVYLTDGNSVFFTAIDALHRRLALVDRSSTTTKPAPFSAGIVVSVGYPIAPHAPGVFHPRRGRDLTPPAPDLDHATLPYPQGGADQFADFVEDVVRPFVHRRVAERGPGGEWTVGREALYGHSFGGLFALHVLFTRGVERGIWDCIIASSPSVWWHGEYLLKEEEAFRGKTAEVAKKRPGLLLYAGGEEEDPPRRKGESDEEYEQRSEAQKERRMVTHCLGMAGRLKGCEGRLLEDVSAKIYPGEDHGTVIACTVSRGLTTFFEDWPSVEQNF